MSDMVYLLSMTHVAKYGEPLGSIFLSDDDAAIAPTSYMGMARAFDTEEDAHSYRFEQALSHMQITPIKAARYFKAKLKDGGR